MKNCLRCQTPFEPTEKHPSQKFCNSECRQKYYMEKLLERDPNYFSRNYIKSKGKAKFPKWKCPDCGTIKQLNFHPTQEGLKIKSIKCNSCTKVGNIIN